MFATVLVTFFALGFYFGKEHVKYNSDNFGLPAGEEELKDGGIYEVENFSFTSWGYLAQLKGENEIVSCQYRVTTIHEMECGKKYMVTISPDKNSSVGVRATFKKIEEK